MYDTINWINIGKDMKCELFAKRKSKTCGWDTRVCAVVCTMYIIIMLQTTDNENKTGYFLCEFFTLIIFGLKKKNNNTLKLWRHTYTLHTWYVTCTCANGQRQKSQQTSQIIVYFVDQSIKPFHTRLTTFHSDISITIIPYFVWIIILNGFFSNSCYDFDGNR